jgi:hypothetical protein
MMMSQKTRKLLTIGVAVFAIVGMIGAYAISTI